MSRRDRLSELFFTNILKHRDTIIDEILTQFLFIYEKRKFVPYKCYQAYVKGLHENNYV